MDLRSLPWPVGCSASKMSLSSRSFSWPENRRKLEWERLPRESESLPDRRFVLHYALNKDRAPEAATIRYLTDAKRSNFTVRVFATGLLSAFGHSPAIAIPD